MSYYDSAEDIMISASRAAYEIEINHGLVDGFLEFQEDMGVAAEYDAQDVLEWLGY